MYTVMRMYTTYIHCLNEHRNEATRNKFEALQFPWGALYQKGEKQSGDLKRAERDVAAAKAEVERAEADVNAAEEAVKAADATLARGRRAAISGDKVAAS